MARIDAALRPWRAICFLLAFLCAAFPVSASRPRRGVVELAVSFQVVNTNTSRDPCLSDGRSYTVRGHITGPRSAFVRRSPSPITVYLYGYEGGEWNWDFKGVTGYDHAYEMAKLGQVSLTIDEVGYGASGHPPNGNLTCQGALADIAHQVIQRLRSGNYVLGRRQGIRFHTIVLAGHDVGGQVAEIEAYSYRDINGLIVMSMADQGFTQWILERSAVAANDWCTRSRSGYVHFVSDEEFRTLLFFRAPPRVIAATAAHRKPNPCGIMRSVPIAVNVDPALEKQIKVPVLVVFGDHDSLIWTRQGERQQQDNFGSTDRSTVFIPNAGHFVMFERSAPRFRTALSSWLESRFR